MRGYFRLLNTSSRPEIVYVWDLTAPPTAKPVGKGGGLRIDWTPGRVCWVGLMGGFQISVLVVEQKMVTEWHCKLSPGLILGAFYTIFRAWLVQRGLGAKFGRKTAQN